MKKVLFCLFYCFGSLALSGQAYERIDTFKVSPLDIECAIIAEDIALDFFILSWQVPLIDSIAKAEGYLPRMELHCFVYDASGMIGSYTGLSTPMSHCTFQTKDSLVEVFFRLKTIPYAVYDHDPIDIIVSLENALFLKAHRRGPEFESLHFPVHATSNRKFTLMNDTNTVCVSYGTRASIDPDGMPIRASRAYSVISLDRYYVSLKTGRIASGQKWIDRKGPRHMVRNSDRFLLVVPSVEYVDRKQHAYRGADLISRGKMRLRKFDLEQLNTADKENYPY